MKVRNTSLHKARMQAANRMLPTWQRQGAPKQTHAEAFALPQWIYRSDRAPSFPQLGHSSHASTGAHFLSAHRSRAHLCHPLTRGLGDSPARPKDTGRSWQNTGAILGKGTAIYQDRWQKSLHVNKAPRNSHQQGSALP